MENKNRKFRFNEKIDLYRKKASELVNQMTLEEKVFQTLHNAPEIKRLGIKSYNWWNEALHGVARAGVATIFPQAIGMAATFDEEMIAKVGDVISTEGRAKFNFQQKYSDTDIYKGLTFWTPNVNIFRDPRWGRGQETLGEDPYLTSRLGVSLIKAMQGNEEYMKVAACAKHFAVHSGPESERHYFNAIVSKQDLHETYLKAFKACVEEAEVEAVMGAYNRTNGEPCCGSKTLLQDILREEWGFEGHVTSDCWAIKDFHEHHKVTSGPVESVALAMNNGCDLNCGNIFIYLVEAVEKGFVKEERLNEAVTKLLVTRMKLGLFEDFEKVSFNKISFTELDCDKNKELNRNVSRETLVLLKNKDNVLPLDKKQIGAIGVIGPNANSRKALVGNYEGTASEYITVLEGIKEQVDDSIRVYYSEGCHLYKDRVSELGQANDRIAEVRAVCDNSDVIIACMGLDAELEGEEGDEGNEFASGDKPDIKLPGLQEDTLKVIKESGKPVILVVLSGSSVALDWADEHIEAIIQGWYPGAQGGRAIADLIFGEFSPEGKLPVTFYSEKNTLPDITDYAMKHRTYRYIEEKPLYPFGYGLSYTDIEATSIKIDEKEVKKDSVITVFANVTNKGERFGGETIQLYIKCEKTGMPNYSLKGIQKVRLNAKETTEVKFELTAKDFGLYDEEANLKIYKGNYFIYVGTSQPDERSIELTKKQVICNVITCEEDEVIKDILS